MRQVVKDTNTIKSFIISYISLKILNNDFKVDTQVPSENDLALKFNCSRLTARSAITVLVHLGILYAIKGSGHYVSASAIKILLPPFFISLNSDKVVNTQISSDETNVYFLSTYYLKNKIIGKVYWNIDKKISDNISITYEKEKDFSKRLINAGIIGIKVIESLTNKNGKTYIKHVHFDEGEVFLFSFELWYIDMEIISKKTYLKM